MATHKHEWQSPQWLGGVKENPGVWGHGGGVIVHEVCECGARKITDTWANNGPNTTVKVLTPDEAREAGYLTPEQRAAEAAEQRGES